MKSIAEKDKQPDDFEKTVKQIEQDSKKKKRL
jgi:hypothetical protein